MGCRGRLDGHACLPLQAWQPLICHLAEGFGPGFALGKPQVWAQCRPLHAAHAMTVVSSTNASLIRIRILIMCVLMSSSGGE